KRINVTVLFINYVYRKQKIERKFFKLYKEKNNNIILYRVDVPSFGLTRYSPLFYKYHKLIGIYMFRKIKKKGEFDLIHAHSFIKGGALALEIKKKYGIPFVITEHFSRISYNNLNSYETDILKKCCKYADCFITVSKALKRDINNIVKINFHCEIIPNLVNSNFVFEKKDNSFVIASVGNLISGKKMDVLIKGFFEAHLVEETLELVIIGDGIQKNFLNNIIHELNAENYIKLLGSLSRNRVVKCLQKSKCMALISEKETFGVSYIEALATGNVLISYHNGGSEEIISKENGIFINKMEPELVKEAILYIYNNYNNYNIKEISKNCITHFGEEAYLNRVLSIYNQILDNPF
ncbi:MAG: glycosyltransferase, partial [Bacilli bacterium]